MRADLLDTAWRAAALLAAGTAAVLGAPAPLRVALWALAAVAVGQRVARARRAGAQGASAVERALDPVLVGVGAVLVALVLLGFALQVVGVPLATTGWSVAVVVAGLATLALTRAHAAPAAAPAAALSAAGAAAGTPVRPGPRAPARTRGPLLMTATWSVVALTLVAVAFSVAVTGARQTATEPLALSLRDLTRTSAEVVVTAPGDAGPLEVRTDAGEGSTLTYPPVTVVDGAPASTLVLLPPKGKVSISVYNAGQSEPLRTVIVDR